MENTKAKEALDRLRIAFETEREIADDFKIITEYIEELEITLWKMN